jgi:hypothetical protein
MANRTDSTPISIRLVIWYLAAVGLLLLAIGLATIVSHAMLAAGGTTLVYSQEAMGDGDGIGPAPMAGEDAPPVPADQATGGMQYVDLPALALVIAGGAIAAAGAIALVRRGQWAVPLGLAGAAVAAVVGSIPAAIGIWAADLYAIGIDGAMWFLVVSAALVLVAVLAGVSVWRHRGALAAA